VNGTAQSYGTAQDVPSLRDRARSTSTGGRSEFRPPVGTGSTWRTYTDRSGRTDVPYVTSGIPLYRVFTRNVHRLGILV
jgi:hypothetical protein